MAQLKVFVDRRPHDVLNINVPRVILSAVGTDIEMEMAPEEARQLGRSLIKQANIAQKQTLIRPAGGNGRG